MKSTFLSYCIVKGFFLIWFKPTGAEQNDLVIFPMDPEICLQKRGVVADYNISLLIEHLKVYLKVEEAGEGAVVVEGAEAEGGVDVEGEGVTDSCTVRQLWEITTVRETWMCPRKTQMST